MGTPIEPLENIRFTPISRYLVNKQMDCSLAKKEEGMRSILSDCESINKLISGNFEEVLIFIKKFPRNLFLLLISLF